MMSDEDDGQLVRRKRLDRLQHVGGSRQDGFLEHRRVGDRAVERRDALDRRVEVFEQLLRDARGDLRAEAARQLILVRDDDPAGLLRVGGDRVPVVRDDRAQIDDRDADAVVVRPAAPPAATAAPARPT